MNFDQQGVALVASSLKGQVKQRTYELYDVFRSFVGKVKLNDVSTASKIILA